MRHHALTAAGAMADTVSFTTEPAPEVLAYFRGKGLKPSFDWRDVWAEEHATAFTVAKATKLDVLETLRQAVDDAIAKGETFASFRANLEPKLQALGWWGRKDIVDPETGKEISAQLGSPRRLRTKHPELYAQLRAFYRQDPAEQDPGRAR